MKMLKLTSVATTSTLEERSPEQGLRMKPQIKVHHSRHLETCDLELGHVNPRMCILFSPCRFFPLGFWGGVFSKVHTGRL
jgi:hypothetical protein